MVEKMKLVRVQGTMPQLNEFIGSCCMDGRFDLEPATRYMSESLGYGALNEENPHTAILDQIETMAEEANIALHEGQPHSAPVDAEGRSYLSDLLEKIDDLCAERKVLLDQKKLCEDGITQYSHFTGLKVNVDDILGCAHVKVRFGFLPTEGYNKLMNNYGDDPYILFTPCSQTKAGYWGVYMTPREKALETDGIFSMLYFEPVHVPGAAGSPAGSLFGTGCQRLTNGFVHLALHLLRALHAVDGVTEVDYLLLHALVLLGILGAHHAVFIGALVQKSPGLVPDFGALLTQFKNLAHVVTSKIIGRWV